MICWNLWMLGNDLSPVPNVFMFPNHFFLKLHEILKRETWAIIQGSMHILYNHQQGVLNHVYYFSAKSTRFILLCCDNRILKATCKQRKWELHSSVITSFKIIGPTYYTSMNLNSVAWITEHLFEPMFKIQYLLYIITFSKKYKSQECKTEKAKTKLKNAIL